MTFKLHRHVGLAVLRRLVPRRYHSQLKWSEFALAETATLLFEHKRKEVVTSAAVRQALDSIGHLEERFKVAVAANLTREASDLLAAKGFCVPLKTRVPRRRQAHPFPERVHYSRTDDTAGWDIGDWETANNLLAQLDPQRRHYAIFELPDGSYVQCLGSKKALTVEARAYHAGGRFTHWVFGKGAPCGLRTEAGGRLGIVTIDRTQVLQMRDARLIIRQFLETRTFPKQYHQQDVTGRMAERPGAGDAAWRLSVLPESPSPARRA